MTKPGDARAQLRVAIAAHKVAAKNVNQIEEALERARTYLQGVKDELDAFQQDEQKSIGARAKSLRAALQERRGAPDKAEDKSLAQRRAERMRLEDNCAVAQQAYDDLQAQLEESRAEEAKLFRAVEDKVILVLNAEAAEIEAELADADTRALALRQKLRGFANVQHRPRGDGTILCPGVSQRSLVLIAVQPNEPMYAPHHDPVKLARRDWESLWKALAEDSEATLNPPSLKAA